MENFLFLLGANLVCIVFLLFAIWALNTNHQFYAGISFIVALTTFRVVKTND